MKKYLPLIGIIFTILIIVFAFWFFFLRTSSTTEQTLIDNGGGFGTFFDTENQGGGFNFQDSIANLPDEAFVKNSRIPILRQLSSEPIAGYTFFKKEFEVINNDLATSTEEVPVNTETEEKYVFRFMERGTGHIFETTEDTLTTEKITNTSVSKIINAIFSENGNKIIFEKLSEDEENIDSFLGNIIDEIEEGGSEQKILEVQPYSILSKNFTLSPKKDLFAHMKLNSDSSTIYSTNFDLKETVLEQSIIKDWLISWDSENYISMFTKPSSKIPGYGYILNIKNGNSEKIFNQINGLTFKLSPDAQSAIYSESNGNSFSLKFKNLETEEIRDFPISAIPEKCVFSNTQENIIYCGTSTLIPSATYPDDWYKGKVSFDDSIWKINTNTGRSETLYQFDDMYGNFDVIDIQLTSDDEFILFKNKIDLTLWSINLKEMDNSDVFTDDSAVDF